MAARDKPMPPEDRQTPPQEWSRMLSFGGLAVAVLGVLLLGAALRTEPPSSLPAPAHRAEAPPPEPLPRPADPAADVSSTPAVAVETPPGPSDPLAVRAAADLERLAGNPAGWTAQLAVLCDAKRVDQLAGRFASYPEFHLLPVLHRDDACFRLCWNRYDTRQAAAAATDMPEALRRIEPRPLPKSIGEVVE